MPGSRDLTEAGDEGLGRLRNRRLDRREERVSDGLVAGRPQMESIGVDVLGFVALEQRVDVDQDSSLRRNRLANAHVGLNDGVAADASSTRWARRCESAHEYVRNVPFLRVPDDITYSASHFADTVFACGREGRAGRARARQVVEATEEEHGARPVCRDEARKGSDDEINVLASVPVVDHRDPLARIVQIEQKLKLRWIDVREVHDL